MLRPAARPCGVVVGRGSLGAGVAGLPFWVCWGHGAGSTGFPILNRIWFSNSKGEHTISNLVLSLLWFGGEIGVILFPISVWFGSVGGGFVAGGLRRCSIRCFETIHEILRWSQGGYGVMMVGMGAELDGWVEVRGKCARLDLGGISFRSDLGVCTGIGGALVGETRPRWGCGVNGGPVAVVVLDTDPV